MTLDLSLRLNSAHSFFNQMAVLQSLDWLSEYERLQAINFPVPETMTLLNPRHWNHIAPRDAVLGKAQFSNVELSDAKCDGIKIWGYECPLDSQAIHIDHVFPYSLGGPTILENALFLCATHNIAKSADIHLIPWEEGFSWMPGLLAKIFQLIKRGW